jgi:hypothetical protein
MRTIHDEGLNIYHLRYVQARQLEDCDLNVQLCQWILVHHWIVHHILLNDEPQFNWEGINSNQNSHLWSADNPHRTSVSSRFSVNVWCGLIGDLLTGPFYSCQLCVLTKEYISALNGEHASGEKAPDVLAA